MNEELQSTNDELQTINDELRERTAQLDESSAFQEAILTSLLAGVTVVDRNLQILVWNRRAEDLWGLRSEEAVGQHFLNLDIGLPTDRLRPLIRSAMSDHGESLETVLPAVNRRGRSITVRVVCTPLLLNKDEASGVILVMEPDDDDGGRPGNHAGAETTGQADAV
jgi:two-component system, chemotaxis family, CheB/CheR fusion protein